MDVRCDLRRYSTKALDSPACPYSQSFKGLVEGHYTQDHFLIGSTVWLNRGLPAVCLNEQYFDETHSPPSECSVCAERASDSFLNCFFVPCGTERMWRG